MLDLLVCLQRDIWENLAFRYLASLISVADGVSAGESEGYSLQWPIRGGVGGGGSSAQKVYKVYERVEISLVEVYERVGKSVILVFKMT